MQFVETYVWSKSKEAYVREGKAYNVKYINYIDLTPIESKVFKQGNLQASYLYDETLYRCDLSDGEEHFIVIEDLHKLI